MSGRNSLDSDSDPESPMLFIHLLDELDSDSEKEVEFLMAVEPCKVDLDSKVDSDVCKVHRNVFDKFWKQIECQRLENTQSSIGDLVDHTNLGDCYQHSKALSGPLNIEVVANKQDSVQKIRNSVRTKNFVRRTTTYSKMRDLYRRGLLKTKDVQSCKKKKLRLTVERSKCCKPTGVLPEVVFGLPVSEASDDVVRPTGNRFDECNGNSNASTVGVDSDRVKLGAIVGPRTVYTCSKKRDLSRRGLIKSKHNENKRKKEISPLVNPAETFSILSTDEISPMASKFNLGTLVSNVQCAASMGLSNNHVMVKNTVSEINAGCNDDKAPKFLPCSDKNIQTSNCTAKLKPATLNRKRRAFNRAMMPFLGSQHAHSVQNSVKVLQQLVKSSTKQCSFLSDCVSRNVIDKSAGNFQNQKSNNISHVKCKFRHRFLCSGKKTISYCGQKMACRWSRLKVLLLRRRRFLSRKEARRRFSLKPAKRDGRLHLGIKEVTRSNLLLASSKQDPTKSVLFDLTKGHSSKYDTVLYRSSVPCEASVRSGFSIHVPQDLVCGDDNRVAKDEKTLSSKDINAPMTAATCIVNCVSSVASLPCRKVMLKQFKLTKNQLAHKLYLLILLRRRNFSFRFQLLKDLTTLRKQKIVSIGKGSKSGVKRNLIRSHFYGFPNKRWFSKGQDAFRSSSLSQILRQEQNQKIDKLRTVICTNVAKGEVIGYADVRKSARYRKPSLKQLNYMEYMYAYTNAYWTMANNPMTCSNIGQMDRHMVFSDFRNPAVLPLPSQHAESSVQLPNGEGKRQYPKVTETFFSGVQSVKVVKNQLPLIRRGSAKVYCSTHKALFMILMRRRNFTFRMKLAKKLSRLRKKQRSFRRQGTLSCSRPVSFTFKSYDAVDYCAARKAHHEFTGASSQFHKLQCDLKRTTTLKGSADYKQRNPNSPSSLDCSCIDHCKTSGVEMIQVDSRERQLFCAVCTSSSSCETTSKIDKNGNSTTVRRPTPAEQHVLVQSSEEKSSHCADQPETVVTNQQVVACDRNLLTLGLVEPSKSYRSTVKNSKGAFISKENAPLPKQKLQSILSVRKCSTQTVRLLRGRYSSCMRQYKDKVAAQYRQHAKHVHFGKNRIIMISPRLKQSFTRGSCRRFTSKEPLYGEEKLVKLRHMPLKMKHREEHKLRTMLRLKRRNFTFRQNLMKQLSGHRKVSQSFRLNKAQSKLIACDRVEIPERPASNNCHLPVHDNPGEKDSRVISTRTTCHAPSSLSCASVLVAGRRHYSRSGRHVLFVRKKRSLSQTTAKKIKYSDTESKHNMARVDVATSHILSTSDKPFNKKTKMFSKIAVDAGTSIGEIKVRDNRTADENCANKTNLKQSVKIHKCSSESTDRFIQYDGESCEYVDTHLDICEEQFAFEDHPAACKTEGLSRHKTIQASKRKAKRKFFVRDKLQFWTSLSHHIHRRWSSQYRRIARKLKRSQWMKRTLSAAHPYSTEKDTALDKSIDHKSMECVKTSHFLERNKFKSRYIVAPVRKLHVWASLPHKQLRRDSHTFLVKTKKKMRHKHVHQQSTSGTVACLTEDVCTVTSSPNTQSAEHMVSSENPCTKCVADKLGSSRPIKSKTDAQTSGKNSNNELNCVRSRHAALSLAGMRKKLKNLVAKQTSMKSLVAKKRNTVSSLKYWQAHKMLSLVILKRRSFLFRKMIKRSLLRINRLCQKQNKCKRETAQDLQQLELQKRVSEPAVPSFPGPFTVRVVPGLANTIANYRIKHPFRCSFCAPSFTTLNREELYVHIRTEHPERCQRCRKTFPSKTERVQHIQECSKIYEEHVCCMCQRTFFDVHQFRRHVETKAHKLQVSIHKRALRHIIEAVTGQSLETNRETVQNYRAPRTRFYYDDSEMLELVHSALEFNQKPVAPIPFQQTCQSQSDNSGIDFWAPISPPETEACQDAFFLAANHQAIAQPLVENTSELSYRSSCDSTIAEFLHSPPSFSNDSDQNNANKTPITHTYASIFSVQNRHVVSNNNEVSNSLSSQLYNNVPQDLSSSEAFYGSKSDLLKQYPNLVFDSEWADDIHRPSLFNPELSRAFDAQYETVESGSLLSRRALQSESPDHFMEALNDWWKECGF